MIVRGVVISCNQFNGYNPPSYELQEGERVLSAELRPESGNALVLYLAVEGPSDVGPPAPGEGDDLPNPEPGMEC